MTLDRMALSALARLEGVCSPSAGTRSVRGGDGARLAQRLPPGRYRVLFRTAPLAILLCDRQGHIVDANAAAVHLGGWSKEALRRTTLHALIAARGPAPRPAASGGPGEVAWEGVLHTEDGSRREVHVLEGRALGGEGGPHPVFVRDRDGRLGGEAGGGEGPPGVDSPGDDASRGLAAGAAHELSNLTAVLLGYAEILRGFVREGAEGPRYLDEVVKAAEEIVALSQALGTYGAGSSTR
ncbi:MAG: PAS domain-containing protein, partial [Planctomycetota bacterium]